MYPVRSILLSKIAILRTMDMELLKTHQISHRISTTRSSDWLREEENSRVSENGTNGQSMSHVGICILDITVHLRGSEGEGFC